MSLKVKFVLSIALLGLLCLMPLSLLADTYTYTGSDFTTAGTPYTTPDSISGSFSVSAALGADGGFTPNSYSFTDGVYTFTPSDSTIIQFHAGDAGAENVSGSLVGDWWIVLELTNGAAKIETVGNCCNSLDESITFSAGLAWTEDNPGSWTVTETIGSGGGGGTPPSVPEPGTLSLLGVGLLGFAGAVCRKQLL